MTKALNLKVVGEILERVKIPASQYYKLIGKSLRITGEYGEYLAAKRLNLKLAEVRTAGYDAVDPNGRLIQIKTRQIPSEIKIAVKKIGSFQFNHQWDAVQLVVIDEHFELRWIFEAGRAAIETALNKTPSNNRRHGALKIKEFISIGCEVCLRIGVNHTDCVYRSPEP